MIEGALKNGVFNGLQTMEKNWLGLETLFYPKNSNKMFGNSLFVKIQN